MTVSPRSFFLRGEAPFSKSSSTISVRHRNAATWSGVFGALSVTPRIMFKDDVDGNSIMGTFIEGRQELAVGVLTSFLTSASLDVSYRAFWGAGNNNLINDRDYLDVVFKYEF